MDSINSIASTLTIPPDYEEIFRRRVLIITGVGRSGTTILGKLIGSMSLTFYLFEPVILRLMPLFIEQCDSKMHGPAMQLMRSILFEDYFLQVIHGRGFNFNPNDDSYCGHYLDPTEIKLRWDDLSRRHDVVRYLKEHSALFVAKIPEFQPLFGAAQKIFVEPSYLHIIRNGFDVVSSALKRGWYTDDFMNKALVEWVETKSVGDRAPWYLDDESRSCFPIWSPATRAAASWRFLTQRGVDYSFTHPEHCRDIKYEDLIQNPLQFSADLAHKFRLSPTKITQRHIESIKQFPPSRYDTSLDIIEEPERTRFTALMKQLNYL